MKKVVVIGGAGFIGRNTLIPLEKEGYEVHVFDIKALSHEFPNVIWHDVNIMNYEQVSVMFKKIRPNYLLNFAWVTKHGDYWNSSENVDCIGASFNALKAFAENGGKRAIMSGSCAEYEFSQEICSEEDTPLNPQTLYGVCKLSMFQIMQNYAKLANISCGWGRIFFTFGPHENDQRLVASVITSLLKDQTAKCSHGLQIRDFLSTSEIGKAFVAFLNSDVTGAVNIASGDPVTLHKVINTIATMLKKNTLS